MPVSVRDDILSFLRNPKTFSETAADADIWLKGLEEVTLPSISAEHDLKLRPAQEAAWRGLADRRVGLVLGPPGTGKTHLLSWLIAGYIEARRKAGLPCRVFVTAFTRNAIGNVLAAVSKRYEKHFPKAPSPIYFGSPPDDLPSIIRQIGPREYDPLISAVADSEAVIGGTIWSLYRFLTSGKLQAAEGPTAPLFDLVCIDEASQVVLGQGLMALAGLAKTGRVVVAGDDQQLPPIRTSKTTVVNGRELGGSFYAFMKSAQTAEFALDETFRLTGPLTAFPERKFYPGRFSSLVPKRKLALQPNWKENLPAWQRVALDPEFPIVVFVHDGPLAATSNPFETKLVAELLAALRDRLLTEKGDPYSIGQFWVDGAAIVSPHRAQNAAIRVSLPEAARDGSFVETVDRIQGKERDAILMSYCVSDPEFALAESDFIFSSERLNVAITRARAKLVLFVSRHLLDAVPGEQEVMDKVETLREFIFSAEYKADLVLEGPSGSQVQVQVRVRGFPDNNVEPDFTEVIEAPKPASMTLELERLLKAIREEAVKNKFGSPTLKDIQKVLALPIEPFAECRELHRLGHVSLEQRPGKFGEFWVVRPFAEPRRVFDIDIATVRQRIDQVVRDARQGSFAPFYTNVRGRFVWMAEDRGDALLPILKKLQEEKVVTLGIAPNGSVTVEIPNRRAEPIQDSEPLPVATIADDDFKILNCLEDIEARQINFGVFDGWLSAAALAHRSRYSVTDVTSALGRLETNGYVLLTEDGRVRSRMAELARELRHVKQRFKSDDAGKRPYLVRSLKLELRDRNKPERDVDLVTSLSKLAAGRPQEASSIQGLTEAMNGLWGANPKIAGFQARGFQAVLDAWRGEDQTAIVFAADTGSGKTEAAVLPMIAAAASEKLSGIVGVRAVLTYPRVRLVANQAQRLANYLSALAQVPGMPLLTIGVQFGQVPKSFSNLATWDREAGWEDAGVDTLSFPFFGCPKCAAALHLKPLGGAEGADALICTSCNWRFDGWVGSKEGLIRNPPSFFLPTADSLHQWLHDPQYGVLFGDDERFAAPRAVLADEIHLYTHIHGAQVGLALRRLIARAEANAGDQRKVVTVGMSATLGEPSGAWGRLVNRDEVLTITPSAAEMDLNPRGREYFYFVQPEVESRGKDIAGASTTIQSLMCLSHGMRRRTGNEGGFRSLVFLDSIDKLRRVHSAYTDAEEARELASLRTINYPDDASGSPRTKCCGDPAGCDLFNEGECWWFAANDKAQQTAIGRLPFGAHLKVAARPVFSGTGGDVEKLIKESDVIFATSSLEVGYDDPDITLVYQHYAPQNLASFVQRKGRGGRGADDRPITGVTLSIYSPRDSWWFRRPREMILPSGFEIPINPENFFVRRGQALCAALDAMSQMQSRGQKVFKPNGELTEKAAEHIGSYVIQLFGPGIWAEQQVSDVGEFWNKARSGEKYPEYTSEIRKSLAWAPNFLIDTINLPAVSVQLDQQQSGSATQREDISFGLPTVSPGNATRRFDATSVFWRPPVHGRAAWFDRKDYEVAQRESLFTKSQEVLRELPVEVHEALSDVENYICRPTNIRLERLGRVFGAGWSPEWTYDTQTKAVRRATGGRASTSIKHETSSSLRGFLLVKADPSAAQQLDNGPIARWVPRIEGFTASQPKGHATGLKAAQVYWGADCEVRLDDPKADSIPVAQTFIDPASQRTLLHGYQVETEGIRFGLNTNFVDEFIAAEIQRLKSDEREARWRSAQFMRYLVESRAQNMGVNAYEARRGADLLVAAAGDPELRSKLVRLISYWDSDALAGLLQETRARLLSEHPLMSERRVARTAEALKGDSFKGLFKSALDEVKRPDAIAGYLRSLLLHSLTLRLRQSFIHVGRGDERRVLAHAKLPIQFADAHDDIITICEAGAQGDGTTRGVITHLKEALEHWNNGFIAGCPNADEDEVIKRFWSMPDMHADWRGRDPREALTVREIGKSLGIEGDESVMPATILRILYDGEVIGGGRIDFYDLAAEIELIRTDLEARIGRYAFDWELASAAVGKAKSESPPRALGSLYSAYADLDDAEDAESLSADARLAEQVYRLGSRLCADGCRGCVHQSSELMSDSLVEATVSRQILGRFLCH
jgi:hypothetical protein